MEKIINLSSKIENLREVERIIDEISENCTLGTEVYGNVLIACLEAVNNGITHGNKLNPEKTVEIRFKIEDRILTFTVKDQGDGFDYNNVPDPTSPENIESVNGRGIFLMEQLSDKLTFLNDGRISEMIFKI